MSKIKKSQVQRKQKPNRTLLIIITTLASRAYNGDADVVPALMGILERMGEFVNPVRPKVPNPVDPDEDFADRWYRPDSAHLMLEKNFFAWLFQAQKDVQHILSTDNTEFLCEIVESKFGLKLNKSNLTKHMGIGATTTSYIIPKRHTPKRHTIDRQESNRPWKW